ncbi:hypothetical protein BJY00DRAFT_313673 [Aspergillus carlsbadensis]|nr:hypothetical protein BJY00DRAFT_313673 [Aspergillus carlsbadensis]
MKEAIRKAYSEPILIFAAAGNEGSTNRIAIPANLDTEVICMFATDANAKAITSQISAATAALMLEFARQSEVIKTIGSHRALNIKTVRGISAVLEKMVNEEIYRCLTPWNIRPRYGGFPDDERRFIASAVAEALDAC